MLYNRRWDKQTDAIGEALNRAADYMEAHGWVRGMHKTLDGRVCLVGAIDAVANTDDEYDVMRDRLSEFLDRPLTDWNDEICPDKDAAVAALRGAAKNK